MKHWHFSELSYEEVQALDLKQVVAIVPVGAIEAHGPHLPLGTDVYLADAMALAGAQALDPHGIRGLILPPLTYSVADFAAKFPGTISIRGASMTNLLIDIASNLVHHGIHRMALANAHLDPGNIHSLQKGKNTIESTMKMQVIFPDITRKPWAVRLGAEFRSGACHAGCYEGSMMMALRPELVNESVRLSLPENPASLSHAIMSGKSNFEQAGGPRAYFGDPSAATAEEGHRTIALLGEILCEAVLQGQEVFYS